MSGKDRIAIFPSRANKVAMKGRIVSANKGLGLLKRKRDALELKLREIVALRAGVAQNFEELFSEAVFSIAKANFLETDFKPALVIGSERADACMRLTYTKTIGLLLPTFEPMIRKPESLPLTGLSRGGKQVDVIRDKFQELLKTIILLASYDYSIKTLQDSIRSNNMRLNGLEFVVIPRFNNTAAYISEELDEMEREEFYRLKRSQGKQRALREKGKKKPDEKSTGVSEVGTCTCDDQPEEKPDKFVLLPLAIFMKKKFASAAQTIITGHFPGSFEMISPTDSIISGDMPTVSKRSSFKPLTLDVKFAPSNNPLEPSAAATKSTIGPTAISKNEPTSTPAMVPTAISKIEPTTTPTTEPTATSKIESPSILSMEQAKIPLERLSTSSSKSRKRVSLAEDDNKIQLPPKDASYHSMLEDNIDDLSRAPSAAPSTLSTTADKNTETLDAAMAKPPIANFTPLSSGKPSIVSVRRDRRSSLDLGSKVSETSMDTSSAVIDIEKYNEPSTSRVPSENMRFVSLHDMEVQTDIIGRYPRRSEMTEPPFSWITDPYTARSQTNVPGRHGRGSNTEHGDTSGSETETEN